MTVSVRGRLAGMMALVYAVQGAWWPLLAIHLHDLGIEGRQRGWIFGTLALASLATPLGAGQVADRMMATQRLLALVYGLGTGLLVLLALGATTTVGPLFVLLFTYWLLTAPAIGLCNSLAFRNLEHPAEQFGGVRLWGTVGWMGVGWLVTVVMAAVGTGRGAYEAFWVAAGLSAAFAAYCLTLPHTPPLAVGGRGIALREAIELARQPTVAVFLAVAFGVCLTTPFVYQAVPPYLRALGLPRAWVGTAMTLGQVLEIGVLAALPRVVRRLGQRRTLALGIAAWAVYFGVLATRPPLAWALAAIGLNGVAIALFHVGGPMFLDAQAPPHRRASVQGLYLVVTSGIGSLLGSLLAGEAVGRADEVGASAFVVPALIDLAMLAVFLAFFRVGAGPSAEFAKNEPEPTAALPGPTRCVRRVGS